MYDTNKMVVRKIPAHFMVMLSCSLIHLSPMRIITRRHRERLWIWGGSSRLCFVRSVRLVWRFEAR